VNHLLREEAVIRQGSTVLNRFVLAGDPDRAYFESGSEGLVQLATDLQTNQLCRIKCFWEPDQERHRRSERLVAQNLAFTGVAAGDALGGAPYEVLPKLGAHTPFAIVMKNVKGRSWRTRKELAIAGGRNPPEDWSALPVRATWAYGLATAIQQLEERGFIHSDISDGNVIVAATGDFALVDFDAYMLAAKRMVPLCRGSEGYAPPEIWEAPSPATGTRSSWLRKSRTNITLGSDRLGLALLAQEFLLMGQLGLGFDDAFGWGYRQHEDICSRRSGAHPAFADHYPALGQLVDRALRAETPAARPAPQEWREELRSIAEGTSHRQTLVLLPQNQTPHVSATELVPNMDLKHTPFGIRATVLSAPDGTFAAKVQPGATLFVRGPSGAWEERAAGSLIAICADLMFFDQRGKLPARISVQLQP
jgi:serine/threonine protein kinase